MDKKKLNAKDFINIGIFTVIYFVMFFITGIECIRKNIIYSYS